MTMFTFETHLPMNRHMSTLPDGRRERRMVERCPVDEAAVVRQLAARNQPRPVAHPAIIVDVSPLGAALRVPVEVPLVPNRRALPLVPPGAGHLARTAPGRGRLSGTG